MVFLNNNQFVTVPVDLFKGDNISNQFTIFLSSNPLDDFAREELIKGLRDRVQVGEKNSL